MKERLEELEQFAIEVILNRRKGVKAGMLRTFLRGLSFLYGGIVGARLSGYRNRVFRDHNLGCLV
ncbi:MAG: tetraacyldisaccharide 4'-kinase, partial [Verrucomicrobiota bacterium]